MDNKTLHFALKAREDKIRLLEQINKNVAASKRVLEKEIKEKDKIISELKQRIKKLEQKIKMLDVVERLQLTAPIQSSKPKNYKEMMKEQGRW